MSDVELTEDAECLGGLTRDITRKPEAVKRSKRYFYSAPPQETKLRSDSRCMDVLTGKGLSNLQVDMDNLSVSFTATAEPDDTLSIGPTGPVDTKYHRAALVNFATEFRDGVTRFNAVHALLRRETPRIKGIAPGSALIDENADLLSQVIDVVKGMDETCLFIQGPPGAGKTFTGSHVILELLKQGKRVGVTSNSHHAINNLLQAVEKRAHAESSSSPA